MAQLLQATSPIATIFGGSGFVGKYVVRRLVKAGWRVRVAVRNPNQALFLKTYGEVGQVEVLKCSIFDQDDLISCMSGSTLVINSVAGVLNETSRNLFKKYYIEGPELIAKQCSKLQVKKFIHISAIGANANSESLYASTKATGEEKVRENFKNAAVVRPSLIFGYEDRFFNRYASMALLSPFLPIIGSNTKFQPVYVDDIALAIEKIISRKNIQGVFELGGPEVLTFKSLIKKMLFVIRRKRIILNIPFNLARFIATITQLINKGTLGLAPLPFTQDNVLQLQVDNVVSGQTKSFKELGIKPQNIDTIIPLYLFSYRPHGQYNEITQSAKKNN